MTRPPQNTNLIEGNDVRPARPAYPEQGLVQAPFLTLRDAARSLSNQPVGTVTGRYVDGVHEANAHGAAYDPAMRSNLRAVTIVILEPFLSLRR